MRISSDMNNVLLSKISEKKNRRKTRGEFEIKVGSGNGGGASRPKAKSI